jgi:hypothetical protein
VSDTKFFAHRAILAARSGFFARMFSFGGARQTTEVVLPEDSTSVGCVLRYIYTGQVLDTELSHEHLLEQIVLADRWDVPELLEHLLVVFERKLAPSTACAMLAWAFDGRPAAVQQVVVKFFAANAHAIKVRCCARHSAMCRAPC